MNRLVLGLATVLTQAVSLAWAAPLYTIQNLGVLPGHQYSWATDINESGQVVGASYFPRPVGGFVVTDSRGFLYRGDTLTDLGVLPEQSQYVQPVAINDAGQVAGTISEAAVFLYTGGQLTNLNRPYPTAVSVRDLNNAGQVLGFDRDGAFLQQGGTTISLPGGFSPSRLNNVGQISGSNSTGSLVLYDNGTIVDLGRFPGADRINAGAINDVGQILATTSSFGSTESRALLYSNGTFADLGQLSSDEGFYAQDLNNAGQVVGQRGVSATRALLYDSGVLYDLSTRVPDLAGFISLQSANAINESGQIVGYGTFTVCDPLDCGFPYETRAFLMTPIDDPAAVPEPGTWALVGGGLLAAVASRGARRTSN